MSNKRPRTDSPVHDEHKPLSPLFTDMYNVQMAYAYWKTGRHNDHAIFDVFFRKCPFKGEFCVFAGLDDVMSFLENFKFSKSDMTYIRSIIPDVDDSFFRWLSDIDASEVQLFAMKEGSVCFPREPLMRVEGPLAVCQLLETALVNTVNYASLVATNAARFRHAAGDNVQLIEFGARRAQGPDGALTAARNCYLAGFDATSNLLAAKLFGIPARGTHAHAFVLTFSSWDDLHASQLNKADGSPGNFVEEVKNMQKKLEYSGTHEGELVAFAAYAMAFPNVFIGVVDTYATLMSGVKNAIVVCAALSSFGYEPLGIRLDSGDLAYLSCRAREEITSANNKLDGLFGEKGLMIFASNNINESVILSLRDQGHAIDAFGIGTHLVTCQAQPALGCVCKLVEVNGKTRIKLTNEQSKLALPGRKTLYRLHGAAGHPLLDFMTLSSLEQPKPNIKLLARHPLNEQSRVFVTPTRVECLHILFFDKGKIKLRPQLEDIRTHCADQLKQCRADHLRPLNATPYKVSVSQELYDMLHKLMLKETPMAELS